MGKKGKNKDNGFQRLGASSQQKSTAATATEEKVTVITLPRNEDGFTTLTPRDDGDNPFMEFMRKRSKKSPLITRPETPMAYEDYDPSSILNRIDKAIEFVTRGKFGKAYRELDKTKLEELIDAFIHMDQEFKNAALVNGTIMKLVMVCKSYYEYDSKSREVIPNAVYDGVLAKLRGIGLDEPTGIVPNTSKKTDIRYPLLHNNMDKAYILKEGELVPEGVKESDSVEDFLRRAYSAANLQTNAELTVELSPKIDGVSINGTVKKGCLVNPQTRGDDSKSTKIPGLSGIEIGPDNEDEFGIQFEAFVLDEDRIKAAEYLKLQKPYASNRHAASGIINRLCASEDDKLLEFLSFYPIECVGVDGHYDVRMKYIERYAIVPKDMIKRKTITGGLDELLKKIKEYYAMLVEKREKIDYSIDGMVITIVDHDVQNACGRKNRTNLYQLGYKFDPANAKAVVKGVTLDAGKKGYRTIQVELEHPVFLDGVRYDHVPVLSAKLFEEMELREGSIVNVHRVGDVIPSISLIEAGNGKKIRVPDKCHYCGGELTFKNKKLICQNPNCKGNVVGKYLAFLEAIGVDGYGESFVEELIGHFDKKNMGNISCMLGLTVDKMKEFGMTDKLSQEFPSKFNEAMNEAPDYVILGAMGWPDIGPARAKTLLKNYGGLKSFVSGFNNDSIDYLWEKYIGKIGKDSATAIKRDPTRWRVMYWDLQAVSMAIKNVTRDFTAKLKVGHTGLTLSKEIVELCKKCDLEIVDGANFDVLITADVNSTSTKMKRAHARQCPIYTESEFIENFSMK